MYYNLGWPGTQRDLPASPTLVLGLRVFATTPSFVHFLKPWLCNVVQALWRRTGTFLLTNAGFGCCSVQFSLSVCWAHFSDVFCQIQEAVDQPSSSGCALLWYKSDFPSALNFFQSNLSEMAMASYILSTFISCCNLVKKWFLIVQERSITVRNSAFFFNQLKEVHTI